MPHADYVLAVKGNQRTLHEELTEYFKDNELRGKIKEAEVIKFGKLE